MFACWRLITCAKSEPPDQREFYTDNRVNRKDATYEKFDYPDNVITSSRYTLWNFLPKCLFEQFQRIANFYFILVMLVQLLIDSPVNPLTTVIPIVFVISISVIKQGVEDILRHRSDNEVNKRQIQVLRDNRFVCVDSCTINVGDVIRCTSNSAFPCDMVLLASSEPSGECAVTTANLDGETSLKIFTALPDTQNLQFETPTQENFVKVTCTQPIEDLYTFHGKLELTKMNEKEQSFPLSAKNLLLRGAVMKNTEFVIGTATYTGYDTKLSLNSKGKKTKYSQVELKLNHFLIIYFVMLFVMSIVCVILLYIYRFFIPSYGASWYIPKVNVTPWRTTQEIFAFIVLYNYLVPISLYVTIELQKFFGAFLFRYDLEMYDPIGNNRARVNTSDLNEELGQITYLFSDKTGTLTENDMQFRRCSIAGVRHIDINGQLCKMAPNTNAVDIDEDNDEVIMDEALLVPYSKEVTDFLLFMSLCHTCRVERDATQPKNMPDESHLGPLLTDKNMISHDGMDYDYQASSPDEKAFLEASRRYGIVYHGLLDGFHCVSMHGGDMIKYKIHEVFEFDSDRKCMSVIVEFPDGSFRFMCKGAESSMLPKSTKSSESVPNDVIMEHLMEYAENGLRTLVFGYKNLTSKEAHEIINEVDRARKSLADSERQLAECYAKFESDLILTGCTGIEDRLQDGVKDTLVDLRAAGIKVWVLTGDKEETAVNISYSAGHFQHDCMQEIRLTKLKSALETNRALETALERIETASNIQPNASYCLVVDGQALKFLMEPALEDQFVQLCNQVSTVLCCRMTPLQKAEIVRMIKLQESSSSSSSGGVTAAIGDGGNDVSMIQEAHVGLGIFGKEGRQAVRASDYAFGKFKYVRKALLIHGHFFYTRITNLIHYFFYKNLVFIMPQFFYSFVSLHSQTTIYYFYVLMLFNVTFTTLPILIYGIWEQSIPARQLSDKPVLYRINRNNCILNMHNFFLWNFFGIYHSLVIFLCCYGISLNTDSVMSSTGHSNDYLMFGMTVFICVWFIVTIKLYISSYFLTWVAFVGFLIIVIGNILLFIIFTVTPTNYDFFGLIEAVWSYPSYWLQVFLVCVLALTPDIIYKVFRDRTLNMLLSVPSTKHKKPRRRVSYVPGLTKNMTTPNSDNMDDLTIANNLNDKKKQRRNGRLHQNGDIPHPPRLNEYDNIAFK